mgnify:CR=1 FL=1
MVLVGLQLYVKYTLGLPVAQALIIQGIVILVAAGFWRRGAFLIGVGVGVAAALRLVLPEDRAGLLVVRTKSLDFATMTTFSLVMLYVAYTIDPLGTS